MKHPNFTFSVFYILLFTPLKFKTPILEEKYFYLYLYLYLYLYINIYAT